MTFPVRHVRPRAGHQVRLMQTQLDTARPLSFDSWASVPGATGVCATAIAYTTAVVGDGWSSRAASALRAQPNSVRVV